MEGQGGAAGGRLMPSHRQGRACSAGLRGTACAHFPECSREGRKTTCLGSEEWEVAPSLCRGHGVPGNPQGFSAEGGGRPPYAFFKKRLFFRVVKDYFFRVVLGSRQH